MGVSTLTVKSKISWVKTVVGNHGNELVPTFETVPV